MKEYEIAQTKKPLKRTSFGNDIKISKEIRIKQEMK